MTHRSRENIRKYTCCTSWVRFDEKYDENSTDDATTKKGNGKKTHLFFLFFFKFR